MIDKVAFIDMPPYFAFGGKFVRLFLDNELGAIDDINGNRLRSTSILDRGRGLR